MILGAHVSIAGSIENAISNALKIGCESFQIFTKNQNQWREKQFTPEEQSTFKNALKSSPYFSVPLSAHSSYLINLCATDEQILTRSRNAVVAELQRCHDLGLQYLVIHPGSHLQRGEEWGINLIAESINLILDRSPVNDVTILLETTAGQGTNIGYRFEHLADILKMMRQVNRVGVCVDTCHIFAAGYDLQTESAYRRTVVKLDSIIGLENVLLFHLNDSKRELGSKIDRHEKTGAGKIGELAFRLIVNDARFADIPGILEIPGGERAFQDAIGLLKSYRKNITA